MRQSQLKKILKSEAYYYWSLANDEDTDALRFGRTFHAITLLPPAEAEKLVSTDVPINPKTEQAYGSTSKKFLTAQAESRQKGVDLITPIESAQIYGMAAAAHKAINDAGFDLELCEKEFYLGFENNTGTLDLLQKSGLSVFVGDLKSCSNIDRIDYDIDAYHYDFQAAWYVDKLLAPLGYTAEGFYLIFVEKKPPYESRIRYLGDEALAVGRMKIEIALARLERAEAIREKKLPFKTPNEEYVPKPWTVDRWSELAHSDQDAPF